MDFRQTSDDENHTRSSNPWPSPSPHDNVITLWPPNPPSPSLHHQQLLNQQQQGFPPPCKRPRLYSDVNEDIQTCNTSGLTTPMPTCNKPSQAPTTMLPPRAPTNNRRVQSNLFFKTRLCSKFATHGTCPYDGHCTFAHGMKELRQPPPNWQDMLASQDGNSGNDQRKSKVCRMFYYGQACTYGARCPYLHVEPQKLEMAKPPMAAGVPGRGSGSASGVIFVSQSNENFSSSSSQLESANNFNQTPWAWNSKTTGYPSYGETYPEKDSELKASNLELVQEKAQVAVMASSSPLVPEDDAVRTSTSPQENTLNERKWLRSGEVKKCIGIYGDWIDEEGEL